MTNTLNGTSIHLSLGSNLGDRTRNLIQARELIGKQIGTPLTCSKIYESEAWGYTSPTRFYNSCLVASTILKPLELLDAIMRIETSLGRIRKEGGYTDRLIDIDLLFYGQVILEHPRLTLPHPAISNRRFVLVPLAEIAPKLVHPLSGLTILEMLRRCSDTGRVTPVANW